MPLHFPGMKHVVRVHTSWSQRMGCTSRFAAAGAVGEGVVGALLDGGGSGGGGGSLRVQRGQARPHRRHLRGVRPQPLHLCGRQQESKNGAPGTVTMSLNGSARRCEGWCGQLTMSQNCDTVPR